jgi:hypothetical protein
MKPVVGELRTQAAYAHSDTPIQLVSKDPDVARAISKLRVVAFYPDTTDTHGNWVSTFKIEVETL